MLIDEIDFAALYRQQIGLSSRTAKTAADWDKRAEKMAATCVSSQDHYLRQLLNAIDLTGARTLLDVGCGPGSVCLNLADKLEQVYGIDYSSGMIQAAEQGASARGLSNVTLHQCAWEDDWSVLPRCDIAVASRSTLVGDLQQALYKINQQARLRIYITHPLNPAFVDRDIQLAIGRTVQEVPGYIYAVNILYQMGIHASVRFIYPLPQQATSLERFTDAVSWSLGGLTTGEHQQLISYYQHRQRQGKPLSAPARTWALLSWQHQPLENQ